MQGHVLSKKINYRIKFGRKRLELEEQLTIRQESLVANPSVLQGLTWSGFYHTDRFHESNHRPRIFVHESQKIKKSNENVFPSAIR